MTEQPVTFSSAGLKLSGVVHLPRGLRPSERRGAFLVLHGFGSNKTSSNTMQPTKVLSELGYVDASIVKLYYSELLQRLTDFGAEVGGLKAHTELAKPMSSGWESGSWMLDFIGSWEWTIPGGSSEIQRTIIGERGLGLPREPSAV